MLLFMSFLAAFVNLWLGQLWQRSTRVDIQCLDEHLLSARHLNLESTASGATHREFRQCRLGPTGAAHPVCSYLFDLEHRTLERRPLGGDLKSERERRRLDPL